MVRAEFYFPEREISKSLERQFGLYRVRCTSEARWPNRRSDPDVYQTQELSGDCQRVASIPPPIFCVQRLFCGLADDNQRPLADQRVPNGADAASVRSRGHDDDSLAATLPQLSTDHADFFGRVACALAQETNRARRNPESL